MWFLFACFGWVLCAAGSVLVGTGHESIGTSLISGGGYIAGTGITMALQ